MIPKRIFKYLVLATKNIRILKYPIHLSPSIFVAKHSKLCINFMKVHKQLRSLPPNIVVTISFCYVLILCLTTIRRETFVGGALVNLAKNHKFAKVFSSNFSHS